MATPLQVMVLRTADLDSQVKVQGVTDRLSTSASPVGGTYGFVRSHHQKWHNGWDLYAKTGTLCFAVTDGEVIETAVHTGYGRTLIMKLQGPQADAIARRHKVPSLYALYGHLSAYLTGKACVMEGASVARTGADGNAYNTPPHLHFELRTSPSFAGGHHSIDPGELLGWQYYACQGSDISRVKAVYGLT